MTGRKWMMVLTDDQVEWIKQVAEKTNLKGSDVGRESIAWVMKDKEFLSTLSNAQYRLELEKIQKQKEEIEELEVELKKKIKEKVAI